LNQNPPRRGNRKITPRPGFCPGYILERIRDDQRVVELAAGISADLQRRLPGQRNTQRDKLALQGATMLDARSANL